MKKRIIYAALFLLLLGIEIYIAENVHDGFIRPYAGDILVVILLYCLLRVIWPNGIKYLPMYVFLFAAFIEILQGIGISSLPFIRENKSLYIAIGSVFDLSDILCYAVGCALIFISENCRWRKD